MIFGKGLRAIKYILVEGCYNLVGADILLNGFSAFLSMGRCKKLGSQNFLLKYLSEGQFCQFSESTKCLILLLALNSFQSVL